MKLNCVNDVLSWFDDACKNSSYGLVVGDDGKFRTRAYFVSMQFVRGVSTGSLLVQDKHSMHLVVALMNRPSATTHNSYMPFHPKL
jgi:hypothetical protein